MPVLGADPDSPPVEWDIPVPARFVRPEVRELVGYFAYHRSMKMSQRCNEQDRAILGRYFGKKISDGYTNQSLKHMVDRFYQSWGADSQTPAMTFVSSKIQDALLSDAEVVSKDPVLQWIIDGMPDKVAPIPDPKGMRKAILIHSGDLTHRYPEMVAHLIKSDLEPELVGRGLRMLDELVKWNLGQDVPFPEEVELNYWRKHVRIPDVLLTGRRSPRSVAEPHGMAHQAVAAIRKVELHPHEL